MSTGKNHSEEKNTEGSTESSEKSRVPDEKAVSSGKKNDNKALDPLSAVARAMGQAQDALGHAQNELINAVTHADVEKRFSQGVSNALARDYKRGKELSEKRQQEGKSARPIDELSAADQRAIRSYQKVHEELPGQLPFYNKEALARDIDRLILSRSVKDEKPAPSSQKPESKPIAEIKKSEEAKKAEEPQIAYEPRKSEPQIKAETARPPEPSHKSSIASKHEDLSYEQSKSVNQGKQAENTKQAKIEPETNRPVLETNRPVLETNRPVLETNRPVLETNRPISDTNRPILETNRPMAIGLRPIWVNEQPFIANKIQEKPAKLVSSEKPLTRSESVFLQIHGESYENLQKYVKPLVVNGKIVIAPSPVHRPRYVIELPPSIPCKSESAVSIRPLSANVSRSATVDGVHPLKNLEPLNKSQPLNKPEQVINKPEQVINKPEQVINKPEQVIKKPELVINKPELVNKLENTAKSELTEKGAAANLLQPTTKEQPVRKEQVILPVSKSAPVGNTDTASRTTPVGKADVQTTSEKTPQPDKGTEPKTVNNTDSVVKTIRPIKTDSSNQPAGFIQTGQSPPEVQDVGSTFVLRNRHIDRSDKYYISGGELVFAAIIALAGTARVRQNEMLEADSQIIQLQKQELELGPNKREQDHIESFDTGVQLRPTLMVLLSDTLNSLAERYLQDINLGWLIADLNRRVTQELDIDGKRVVRLKVRQILTLPTYSDIQRFYSVRTQSMSPSRLVTIVEDTQLSREVMDNTLAPFTKPS